MGRAAGVAGIVFLFASVGGAADFSLVDATNLAANAGHVDHFFIQLLDADDVNLKFTFGGGAGKPAVENIVLKRVRRAD